LEIFNFFYVAPCACKSDISLTKISVHDLYIYTFFFFFAESKEICKVERETDRKKILKLFSKKKDLTVEPRGKECV
jgi:hypothetical protein